MTTAARTVPHLQTLTGAAAIALADTRSVLAIEGEGREQVRPGDLLSRLLERTPDDEMQIVPRPGRDSTRSRPPTAVASSRIEARPSRRRAVADGSSGSNPRPSSVTSNASVPEPSARRIVAVLASAYFEMFCSASRQQK